FGVVEMERQSDGAGPDGGLDIGLAQPLQASFGGHHDDGRISARQTEPFAQRVREIEIVWWQPDARGVDIDARWLEFLLRGLDGQQARSSSIRSPRRDDVVGIIPPLDLTQPLPVAPERRSTPRERLSDPCGNMRRTRHTLA